MQRSFRTRESLLAESTPGVVFVCGRAARYTDMESQDYWRSELGSVSPIRKWGSKGRAKIPTPDTIGENVAYATAERSSSDFFIRLIMRSAYGQILVAQICNPVSWRHVHERHRRRLAI